MPTTLERASGRWPELLMALAGLSPEQLTDTHQPCPACGGTDRYRWDRDDGPGGCYCNQCGGKDQAGGGMSGLDLLLRVTGWDLKQAIRRVRSHLDPGGTIDATPAAAAPPQAKKPKRPARIPDRPPAGTPPPDLGGAVAQWPYFTADDLEQPAFWIQRVDTATGKLFIHRTWLDGRWHYPSKRDPFTSEWPAPRPLYRLPELIGRPDAPVLIAEGEKSADAGATLFPDHAVIAWCGGVAGLNHADWSPLAGRTVILWPDNDDPGRKAMAKLGPRLQALGATVSIFNPPPEAPPKFDLADAAHIGWTPRQTRNILSRHLVEQPPLPEPTPEPEPPPPPPPAPPVEISEFSQYFDCLGTDGDGFYYKIHATGHVKRLSAGAHTSTHLVFLAPVTFWESAFPGGRSGANWTAAASRLAQLQASVGFYDESRVRSCGAWWDRGRCVLNLGDRLVVDGIEQSIRKPVPSSRFIYKGGKALRGTDGATPLSDDEAMMIGLIAEQFLWEVKASGPLLAGWVTLAPICGVLDWRPHIWLTASAESGKSTVLNRYIAPLLGSMAVSAYGQSSEAGIRQTLDSKAIAVIFDEAESNEKSDKARMQNVLTLARIASTESDAQMLKGSPEGKSTGYSIRSMFLLCSIATALKQGADKTRFAQLTLQNPSILGEARHARWKELDQHLDQFITPEIGRRLQARTISLIPMIREATKTFVDATAQKFNSRRMGDQYGTLLAGTWSLRHTHAPTPDEARAFLDTIDGWEPYREESTGTPDERSCIEAILQFQVRVEGERSTGLARTVAELIDMTDPVNVSPTDPITSKGAKEHLGRVGLKVQDGRLYIHNNAAGIRRILAETPWSDCWPTVLRRLPDARKEAATNFFGHRGNHRATSVPLTALDQV